MYPMYTAENNEYRIVIDHDDCAPSPRDNSYMSNLGTMVCWHKRCKLGDKHDYEDPEDFLQQILSTIEESPVLLVRYLKSRQSPNAYLEYNSSTQEWELFEHCWWLDSCPDAYDGFQSFNSAPESQLYVRKNFFDAMVASLSISDYLTLLRRIPGFVMLPIFMYDHSGITISTKPFGDRFDSGQVGWIYCTPEDIRREYGKIYSKNIAAATQCLEEEVNLYDHYLRGDCYGYQLFKGEEEIDASWGFLGDFDEVCREIREVLPENAANLMENIA